MQLPLSKTNSCQPEEKHITYVHIHTSIRLYTYIIYVSKPVCINISSHIFSLSYSLSLSICFSLCVVAYVCVCANVYFYQTADDNKTHCSPTWTNTMEFSIRLNGKSTCTF